MAMKKKFRLNSDAWREALLAVLADGNEWAPGALIVEAAKRAGHPRPHKGIPAARNALKTLEKEGGVEKHGKGRHVTFTRTSSADQSRAGKVAKAKTTKQPVEHIGQMLEFPEKPMFADIVRLAVRFVTEGMDEGRIKIRTLQESIDRLQASERLSGDVAAADA